MSDGLWNGLNIVPPMMHFDTVSTLGIVTRDREHPRVSFALNGKPFASDVWFHTQHLVASVTFLGNPLFKDDLHTLKPPYIPGDKRVLRPRHAHLRQHPDRARRRRRDHH